MTGPGSPAGDAELVAGRYRLGGLLGQGGMADVHRAIDERTEEPVAVKLVRSSEPAAARRLAQEAKALERLRHPGLVQLLDTGVVDGRAYLVMELVEGRTLGEVVRAGPMAPSQVADMAATVAGALAYVHAQGIVHRDVKPGNILVDGDGRARLADFGIASLADASMLTATGTTLGTAAYMAPEQLQHHGVGPAADVWSMGMVLLECLLGRRIYEGPPAQVVARRLAGPVPVPADLPEVWRSLLGAMFAAEPDRRPAAGTVAEVVTGGEYRRPWAPSETVPLAAGTASLAAGTVPLAAGTMPLADEGLTLAAETAAMATAGAFAPTVAAAATARGSADTTAPTAVGPTRPTAIPPWRQRQWQMVAVVAMAAVVVIVLLATLLGSGAPARSVAGTTENRATTPPATSAPTTAPTTTTTTAPPSPAAASGALLAAVAQDVTAGALTAGQGTAIGADVSAALIDVTTGDTVAATNRLDDAASTVASAGATLPAADAATLQADLATLAATLGLATPVASTAPSAPTGPGGGPPPGGNQGPGPKSGKNH